MDEQDSGARRDRRVQVLFRTIEEKGVIEKAARDAGLPTSAWCRRALLEAAGRPDLLPESPEAEAARALAVRRHRRR